MECPSKKNGNAYSIIWDNGTISTMQVPQNWIKSQFISTKTVKERLREYIEAYRPNGEPSVTQQQQQQSQVSLLFSDLKPYVQSGNCSSLCRDS